jgi:hypothetical protein
MAVGGLGGLTADRLRAVVGGIRPSSRDEAIRAALLVTMSVFGVAMVLYLFWLGSQAGGSGFDALAYWSVNTSNPYEGRLGDLVFTYSPPMALAFRFGHLLSFDAFRAIWLAIQVGALLWLGRRYALALLLFLPVSVELYNGNIHLLLGVAIVLGFRYPATWSLLLLTKVTPGVGLLWFVVRREWRNLAIALGATAAISLASLIIVPEMWWQWLGFLASNSTGDTPVFHIGAPLPIRLTVAAAIVIYGARSNRRWTVPVAVVISLPVIWFNGLAVLAAIVPLWKGDMAAQQRAKIADRAPAALVDSTV